MLKPKVGTKEFEKFGFEKCKGNYGKLGLYYLCVAKGCRVLLVSGTKFSVIPWLDNDPRIHKKPNCNFNDKRDYMDIICALIKADMLEGET